jgi:hypothetical protein
MAEATQYVFKHKELVTMLIKHQGLHEGIWQLQITFGFAATNAGPSKEELSPAAVVQVQSIGINKVTEETGLTVDAAQVNPAE